LPTLGRTSMQNSLLNWQLSRSVAHYHGEPGPACRYGGRHS
jgi:hypothetical protein